MDEILTDSSRKIKTNVIHNESCIDTLKRLPDECIDCIITSPPYWQLRSYKGTETAWGGDENCTHMKTVLIELHEDLGIVDTDFNEALSIIAKGK